MKSVRGLIQLARSQADRDFGSAVLVRISGTMVAALSAVLLVTHLSPEEQGYWYTFASILSIAAFAEMGAGQILMRCVAREVSKLQSNPIALNRLQNIFRFGAFMASGVCLITTVVSLLVGLWWLPSAGVDGISWQGPWLLAAIASAPTIFLGFANSYFEGWQLVTAANLRRTVASWFSLGALWFVFALGGGLLAFGLSRLSATVYGLIHVFVSNQNLIKTHNLAKKSPKVFEPRTEYWPLQLRYGLTWATGIMVNGLYAPLVFRFDGAVSAGQYGMSLSIVSIISGLATSLIGARQAKLAAMAGVSDHGNMRRLLCEIIKFSALAFLAGSAALFLILFWAPEWALRYTERLLPLSDLLLLLIAQFFWLFITIYTTYVRSFNIEPFVKLAWWHAAFSAGFGLPAVILYKTSGILFIALLGNAGSAYYCWKISQKINYEY